VNASLVSLGLFIEFAPGIIAIVALVLAIVANVRLTRQVRRLRFEIATLNREPDRAPGQGA
jgi:hypothetical protein